MKSTLDDKLKKLTNGLKPPEKKTEVKLRQQWVAAEKAFRKSRYDLGKALAGYEALYKGQQQWLRFLKVVEMPRKTADDYIARYKVAAEIPPKYRAEAERQHVDLGKPAVLKLVNIDAWKKAATAKKGAVEAEVAKLKAESKRPSNTGTAQQANTQAEREESIRKVAVEVYKNVPPGVRSKELPEVMNRLTNYLIRHFAIQEAV
jgi:hypothetical protein